jgi:hypothetical protein
VRKYYVPQFLNLNVILHIVSACAIFQEDDKLHMIFSYMHCWKILKDQLKSIERHKHMNAPKPPPKPAVKKQKKTSANTSLTLSPLAITAADEFADKNKSLTNTANKNQDK